PQAVGLAAEAALHEEALVVGPLEGRRAFLLIVGRRGGRRRRRRRGLLGGALELVDLLRLLRDALLERLEPGFARLSRRCRLLRLARLLRERGRGSERERGERGELHPDVRAQRVSLRTAAPSAEWNSSSSDRPAP